MSDYEVRDGRPGRFWMDDDIMDVWLPQLGAYGFAVYAMLCRRADKNGDSHPSIRRMADDLGFSERQVKREIKKLCDLDLVSIRRNRQKGRQVANTYTVEDVVYARRVPVSHPESEIQSDSDTPGGEGTHSHPTYFVGKEDTEKKEDDTSLRSVSAESPSENGSPPPRRKVQKLKQFAIEQLMDRVSQARDVKGWRIHSPTNDERKQFASFFEQADKDLGEAMPDEDERTRMLLWAFDYQVEKAGNQIPREKPAWCGYRTALDRVIEGWRPTELVEEMTEQESKEKEEYVAETQEILRKAMAQMEG